MRQQRKTTAEAPVQLDESAVVTGIAHRRVDDGDVAELRKWTQQLRITGADPLRRNLVDGQIGSGQVMADVADVSHFEYEVTRDLVLQI